MTTPPEKSGIRMSAEERRHAVLAAAVSAFARGGYTGTSTEEIARLAGISQPYLFRLFRTKKELFLAAINLGWDRVEQSFDRASLGLTGEEALEAMGAEYTSFLANGDLLLLQLHGYAASSDGEIRAEVGRRFSELAAFVEERSGVDRIRLQEFFSVGMLLNVVAALGVTEFSDLCDTVATERR